MAKVSPHTLKGIGYLVSTVSVILLAIVSWKSASQSPLLLVCLFGGAAASMIGMCFRWASYVIEKRHKGL
jgi:nicotinamide riboside transporter PnuC